MPRCDYGKPYQRQMEVLGASVHCARVAAASALGSSSKGQLRRPLNPQREVACETVKQFACGGIDRKIADYGALSGPPSAASRVELDSPSSHRCFLFPILCGWTGIVNWAAASKKAMNCPRIRFVLLC